MHADFKTEDPRRTEGISTFAGMKYVGKRLLRHKYTLGAVLVLSIGVALAEGLSLGLVLPFLESIRGEGSSSTVSDTPAGILIPFFEDLSTVAKIRTIAIALFLIQGTKSIMMYLSTRLEIRLQIKVERDFRIGVFEHLLRAGMGFIYKEKLANLFTILHNFTGNSANLARTMVSTIPYITTLTLYVVLLLTISWELTLVAIGMAGLTTVMMGRLTGQLRVWGSKYNQAAVRLNHVGLESLSAMRLIRLFAREDYTRERFIHGVDDLQQQAYGRSSLQALVSPLFAASNVLVLALLLVAATFIFQQDDTAWVELAVIFMVVLFRLMGPTSNLNSARARIAGYIPALQSMIEFFRNEDKQFLPEGAAEFKQLRDGIELERVSFRYSSTDSYVLKDVSFAIPKGKMTAIVGASGSGKSTLVSLLARLYDPTEGCLAVDGVDLKDYKSSTWRRRVGVVSQDTFLFNDTLRSNIRFGRLDATDEEIEDAARKANAHQFTLDMPDGYETMLGDRGIRLSGGEGQRVAIARAILAEPELLILDEATSALDTEAERLVQEAIDRVTEQRTVVAVAHRLSTIREADNIVVLEKGEVVEQGTHDELIAKRGRYWHFVRLQDLGPDGDGEEVEVDGGPAKAQVPRAAIKGKLPSSPEKTG